MIRARAAGALALVTALLTAFVPAGSAATPPAAAHGSAALVIGQDTVQNTLQEVLGPGSAGVEITQVSPIVAAPGQPVRISGTLDVADLGIDLSPSAAPTSEPTTGPADGEVEDQADPEPTPVATVEVRLAPERITDGAAVAEWASSSSPSAGPLLVSQPVLAGDRTRTAATTVPFSITVDDLDPFVATSYGIAPISIQVYLPGQPAPVRVVHTFLGFQATKEYAPLGLTVVVPFTLPADPALIGAFGEERATAWEGLLSESGRLSEQITLAAAPGVVWAVDPLLLSAGPAVVATDPSAFDANGEPLDDSTSQGTGEAGGATSGASNGTASPRPEDGASDAPPDDLPPDPTPGPAARERAVREAYVQRMLEAAAGRDIMLLPTGDADFGALPEEGVVGAGPDAARRLLRTTLDVEEATTLLENAGAAVRPVLWPAGGMWSAGQDEVLRSGAGGGGWDVLVDTGSIAAADLAAAQAAPLVGPRGGQLLAYESALSTRVATAVRDGGLLGGLTLMAEGLMTLNERPGTARHQVVVLDRPADLLTEDAGTDESPVPVDLQAPLRVLGQVPWLTLGQIPRASAPGELEATPTVDPGGIPPTALTEERLAGLGDTEARLEPAAALRVNTGIDLATRGRDSLGQLLSSRWRSAQEDWDGAYAPLADQVASTFTSIHIPARDIAFLADSGLVRVTVENSLDDGLHNATMELAVDHPVLRIESGPQPVDVGADSRSTVSFQASAIASGRVSVTAVVRTEDGIILGEPTTFTVRVSPTSDWIYWLLGGLAGLVILIGIVRTVLRRHPEP